MHSHIERLAARRSGFRVICAWCGQTLLEGNGETSHGLCDACADGMARSIETIARRRRVTLNGRVAATS